MTENELQKKEKPEAPPRYNVKNFARVISAAIAFIIGFNFSNTLFFRENPLFGINFLAETVISCISFLFGFFIIPAWFVQAKRWIEKLIIRTISDIVSAFWSQQSARLREAQEEKRKAKDQKIDEKVKENMSNGVILDTSVLIDGRILDIARLGFINYVYIIHKSVLHELHLISDNQEGLKRQRGRRGLQVAEKLKRVSKVFVLEESTTSNKVDNQLLTLAKKYKLPLMTLDFNLNKLASVSGVKVLNLNELANALKAVVLPGEMLNVKIISQGKEKAQGVGYMPDGTMIVVEDAKDKVGQDVEVKIAKVIQTPAGKMIFSSPV